jgi:hypothetical protein
VGFGHIACGGVELTGLACPEAASLAVVQAPPIARVLSEYRALNATNLALTAISLKHVKLVLFFMNIKSLPGWLLLYLPKKEKSLCWTFSHWSP